jgi:hypothetical protein
LSAPLAALLIAMSARSVIAAVECAGALLLVGDAFAAVETDEGAPPVPLLLLLLLGDGMGELLEEGAGDGCGEGLGVHRACCAASASRAVEE